MVKSINEQICTKCGLCEAICPVDLFRQGENAMRIVYPGDCCNCLQCLYICPTDAITVAPGTPKKLDMRREWETIKNMLSS